MVNSFKSICHTPYHSSTELLDRGKEYKIVPCEHFSRNGYIEISHHNIYYGDIPIIVYMKTPISGLSSRSFTSVFHTKEQMGNIKLNNILNI